MKGKCFGEFVCSSCGRVTKQKFAFSDESQINNLGITCGCGKYVETFIPVSMREPILCLAQKGYKMKMFNESTLGIVLAHKLDVSKLPELPYEFSYDATEEDVDIIMNARMANNDYEGIDKDKYIADSIWNLLDFCRALPTLSDGEYIVNEEEIDLDTVEPHVDEELEALKQGLKEDVTEFVDQVAAEMEANEEESDNDLSDE